MELRDLGALHGVALAGTRMWQRRSAASRLGSSDAPEREREPDGWAPLKVFFTFPDRLLAWVFFRAPTFGHATLLLGRIGYAPRSGTLNLSPRVILVLALGMMTTSSA